MAEHDVAGAERAMIDHLTRANVQDRRLLRPSLRNQKGTLAKRGSAHRRRRKL